MKVAVSSVRDKIVYDLSCRKYAQKAQPSFSGISIADALFMMSAMMTGRTVIPNDPFYYNPMA